MIIQQFLHMLKKTYRITVLPLFADNYSYILQGHCHKKLILVDPAQPNVVLSYLKQYLPNYTVSDILYTHKHWDHAGGCKQLYQELKHPDLKVYIGQSDKKEVPTANTFLQGNQQIKIGKSTVKTYNVPCHTRGHVVYHFLPFGQLKQDQLQVFQKWPLDISTIDGKKIRFIDSQQCAFTGDTIFCGGIGKFFQGSAEQMVKNVELLTKQIHDEVHLYNGHQYTYSCMKWNTKVEDKNLDSLKFLAQLQEAVKLGGQQNLCTLPTTFKQQKLINPFIRSVTGTYLHQTVTKDRSKLMGLLRETKNKGLTQLNGQIIQNSNL